MIKRTPSQLRGLSNATQNIYNSSAPTTTTTTTTTRIPGKHWAQLGDPLVDWELPGLQGEQLVAEAAEYRPAAHAAQVPACGAPENVPAAQPVQLAAPPVA